jgi:hypothetical protein
LHDKECIRWRGAVNPGEIGEDTCDIRNCMQPSTYGQSIRAGARHFGSVQYLADCSYFAVPRCGVLELSGVLHQCSGSVGFCIGLLGRRGVGVLSLFWFEHNTHNYDGCIFYIWDYINFDMYFIIFILDKPFYIS